MQTATIKEFAHSQFIFHLGEGEKKEKRKKRTKKESKDTYVEIGRIGSRNTERNDRKRKRMRKKRERGENVSEDFKHSHVHACARAFQTGNEG